MYTYFLGGQISGSFYRNELIGIKGKQNQRGGGGEVENGEIGGEKGVCSNQK